MQDILIQPNARARQRISSTASTSDFAQLAATNARRFHETIPGYQRTPLHTLPALGGHLNLQALWLKDESQRFGLNAFKGLGASYAVARLLAKRLELDQEDLSFGQLTTPAARAELKEIVFASATAPMLSQRTTANIDRRKKDSLDILVTSPTSWAHWP